MPTTDTATPAEAVALTVRRAMLEENLRVCDLAQYAGLSIVQVSRRLNGHVRWTPEVLARVARAVGVPSATLVALAFPEVGQDDPEAGQMKLRVLAAVTVVGLALWTVPVLFGRFLLTLADQPAPLAWAALVGVVALGFAGWAIVEAWDRVRDHRDRRAHRARVLASL